MIEKYDDRILKGTITEYYFLKRMMTAVFVCKKYDDGAPGYQKSTTSGRCFLKITITECSFIKKHDDECPSLIKYDAGVVG